MSGEIAVMMLLRDINFGELLGRTHLYFLFLTEVYSSWKLVRSSILPRASWENINQPSILKSRVETQGKNTLLEWAWLWNWALEVSNWHHQSHRCPEGFSFVIIIVTNLQFYGCLPQVPEFKYPWGGTIPLIWRLFRDTRSSKRRLASPRPVQTSAVWNLTLLNILIILSRRHGVSAH